MEEYNWIINPITKRRVNINSRLGKSIIKTYNHILNNKTRFNTNKTVGGANNFVATGTVEFYKLLKKRWFKIVEIYKHIDTISDSEEYWSNLEAYEKGINSEILLILSEDENLDFFNPIDEYGKTNTFEGRLKKWYSENLTVEQYRKKMDIQDKIFDLRSVLSSDYETNLNILYNYPDHRVIAGIIISERDYLDEESTEEEIIFWTSKLETEFVETYKKEFLDYLYPMPKAAIASKPRL